MFHSFFTMLISPISSRRIFLILLLVIGLFSLEDAAAFAQEISPPDTTQHGAVDSARIDSAAPSRDAGADTLVNYYGAEIDFDVVRRVTVLTGDAVITYKDMRLEAGRIEVNWDEQILIASAIAETLYADSAETEIDTIFYIGRPHFQQGREDFDGDEIAYNLKTKIGRVRGGSTIYEDGHYYGKQFKRLNDENISVTGGIFTTCDADTPHYHFAAKDLKVSVGKRVIARPVILCFDGVPVMAAPYGIFPQQKGRTSGIIIPTFGESANQGRFLRNIGYYWAISDYMDARGSFDYFEKFGFRGRGNFRYTKRYSLDGNVNFDFNLQRQDATRNRDYSVSATHSQIINSTTRLTWNGQYISDISYVNNTGTTNQQLNQSILSNATLSKSFLYAPWTIGVNVGYNQNLKDKTWRSTLPQINLTHTAHQLFPPPKPKRGIRGAVVPKELTPPWYRALQYSYSMAYRNEISLPRKVKEEGIRIGRINENGTQAPDTIIYGSDTTALYQKDGLIHNASFSANARIFKYLNLNPRINAKSMWMRTSVSYSLTDSVTLDREDKRGFFQRTTFDIGGSVSTKLYGMMRKPFGIQANFRDMMTPEISFSYRPDFSKDMWGYFQNVTLPDGRTRRYDRLPASDNIGGESTPVGRSERFGFSLNHLFQMKTVAEEESDIKRFDLLKWNTATAVDMRKDSLKWDNFTMIFGTSTSGKLIGPVTRLSVDYSTTHSFYQYVNRRPVEDFYWDRDGGAWYSPINLLTSTVDFNITLQPESIGELFGFVGSERTAAKQTPDSTDVSAPFNPAEVPDVRSLRPSSGGKFASSEPSQLFDMPFTMDINIRSSRDHEAHTNTSSFSARSTLNLTPNWDVNFNYTFDLERREVRNVGVSVVRDLHCWEASFQWSPLGYDPGYFLKIGLRSPQLQDVKIERHRGGGYGGY